MKVKRGDVVYRRRTEDPMTLRPYVVVSNNVGNRFSDICLVVPLTSRHKKLDLPTHTLVSYHDSMVMAEQVHTIRQEDVERVAYHLDADEMKRVTECLRVSIGGRFDWESIVDMSSAGASHPVRDSRTSRRTS